VIYTPDGEQVEARFTEVSEDLEAEEPETQLVAIQANAGVVVAAASSVPIDDDSGMSNHAFVILDYGTAARGLRRPTEYVITGITSLSPKALAITPTTIYITGATNGVPYPTINGNELQAQLATVPLHQVLNMFILAIPRQ
jgi:hypothetical protein